MRFLVITRITPVRIRATPKIILAVRCSWKNITPKNIAVKGSSAPSIAVVVEPISFIEIVIVSSEIIVGKSANPKVQSHKKGLSIICLLYTSDAADEL